MSWELRSSEGNRIKITRDVVKVGRASENTVVVNDPAVSRFHLNFYLENNELIVEDAGSQNGFTVNGQKVTGAVKLTSGDRVGIGSKEYLVQSGNESLVFAAKGHTNVAAARPQSTDKAPGAMLWQQANAQKRITSQTTNSPNRVLIFGILVAAIGAIYFKQQENTKRQPASLEKEKKIAIPEPLSLDGREKFRQKGITEIQAEAKFRETLRDFYNRNYSRAILGFNEVLILNGNHEEARYHLLLSKEYLRNEMQSLYDDAERSYGNLQYRRTKAQTMKVLTYIAEQIPSYGRKIAEETAKNPEPRSTSQDENLLTLPCKSYPTDPEICLKSQKLLRAAREKLGDEDALKEVR
jgi:hypothetical protein